jgi:hypothetical protein
MFRRAARKRLKSLGAKSSDFAGPFVFKRLDPFSLRRFSPRRSAALCQRSHWVLALTRRHRSRPFLEREDISPFSDSVE